MRAACTALLLLAGLGGCASKEIEIVVGGPADSSAPEAPRAPGLAPLSSGFDPERAAPSASPAAGDPHQHHHHGHEPATPPKTLETPPTAPADAHEGHDHGEPR